MTIYEKLLLIQDELNCPKNLFNKFGNYSYRSAEMILESAKPICKKYDAVLFVTDKIVNIGDRYYIEATATLVNVENPEEKIEVTSDAREEETKKGMDASQITGAASSYARKYALNGLFCIDDTKDADATNTHGKDESAPEKEVKKDVLSPNQLKVISGYTEAQKDYFLRAFGVDCIENLSKHQATQIIKEMNKAKEKNNV